MKIAKILKVYEIATHAYDETQREMAFRVLLSTGRRCWLVAYGANFLPAKKEDLENLYDHITIPKENDGSEAYSLAMDMIGDEVYAYRS